MFTTIMWLIATAVFRFYLEYFARYDILYGNLSSIIILMVWVYFLSYIFVLGMAINVSRKEEQELVLEQLRLEEELKAKKAKKKTRKNSKKIDIENKSDNSSLVNEDNQEK